MRRSELDTQQYGAAVDPPYLFPDYVGTRLRAPSGPLLVLPATPTELTAPVFGESDVRPGDADLTRQHDGEPLGERMVVTGRVLDEVGKPVRNTLVEVWQANAAGRYVHRRDDWPGPLDPHFLGIGRCKTNDAGEYRFLTVMPGAYPWRNHPNAWRPAHVHFSVFGRAFADRLVTQMYFPGDPLFAYDPIFQSIRDERARDRLISAFDLERTEPDWALAYRFDIVLRSTPFE